MTAFNHYQILITLVSMALPGCASKTYIPDSIDVNAINSYAIIESENVGIRRIHITSVDNNRISGLFSPSPRKIYLSAGHHKLYLQYADRNSSAKGCAWLFAKGGRSYTIRPKAFGDTIEFWFESNLTGKRVGGVCR